MNPLTTALFYIAFILVSAMSYGQTTLPPIRSESSSQKYADSVRKAVEAELRPKIAQELQTEQPYIFICYSTKRTSGALFYIIGFVRAGMPFDSKHKPLDTWIGILDAKPIAKTDKK